jgi:3-deoxy-manno-octulosonate cytidylyltransferase (CMP-KDO synthetase)
MRKIAIIPARLESTRLPRKVLADIAGRPMLWHVYEAAASVLDAVVATDSDEVAAACARLKVPCVRTVLGHPNGTSRVTEAAVKLKADFVVNVQADEPLVHCDDIARLAESEFAGVTTLAFPIGRDEAQDPNRVKVVIDEYGEALYFSRLPLESAPGEWLGHVGVYAYPFKTLLRCDALPSAPPERAERLEQLRWLVAGIPVCVLGTAHRTVGVDTQADLDAVRRLMGQEVTCGE